MPSDISNAIGTERQFTPQPKGGYIGNYGTLQAERVFYQHQSDGLAESMARLTNALSNYQTGKEKFMEQSGIIAADRMIHSMTPEDIEKLNTIDAAQAYGFLDDTANPYFRAYADKARGSFLSARMKREYDEEYAMTPAVSMDEEAKRYSEWQKTWKEKHTESMGTVINKTAFDIGYNEAHQTNLTGLWNKWQEKRREEDVTTTIATITGELGQIAEALPSMLNEEGGMESLKAQVQETFNPARLMGLPMKHRQTLISQFMEMVMQTGRLDKEGMHELLNGINIQTTLTGENVTAAQILDTASLGDMSDKWHSQFITKETLDMIKDHIQREDGDGWVLMVEDLMQTDPNKAAYYNKFTNSVLSGIEAKQKADRAAAEKARKEALNNKKTEDKTQVKTDYFMRALEAEMRGSDTFLDDSMRPIPVGAAKFDKDVAMPIYTQMYFDAIDRGDMETVNKLITSKVASGCKELIKNRMKSDLALLNRDSIENGQLSTRLRNEVQYLYDNRDVAEAYLGAEIAKEGLAIATLADLSGSDLNEGLKLYATYRDTPEDVRKGYRDNIKGLIKETFYTIDNFQNFDGGWTTVDVYNNPDMEKDVLDLATALKCTASYSDEDALNMAAHQIREQFYTWRGTFIPKAILTSAEAKRRCGTAAPYCMLKALEDYAGAYGTPRYDRRTQTFNFGAGNGRLKLDDLYSNAERYFIDNIQGRDLTPEEKKLNDTEWTAEEANQHLGEVMHNKGTGDELEAILDVLEQGGTNTREEAETMLEIQESEEEELERRLREQRGGAERGEKTDKSGTNPNERLAQDALGSAGDEDEELKEALEGLQKKQNGVDEAKRLYEQGKAIDEEIRRRK